MRHLIEPARRLPIREDFDVVVVGGGIAGVAAALAAARERASVCLIEKEYALGGLATLGNVIVYLPVCDGTGQLVSGGLAESLLKLSIADDAAQLTPSYRPIPEAWTTDASREDRAQKRYACAYNPATYAMRLERLLGEAGVTLRYDARFAGVIQSRGPLGRIKAVVIEDKAGRSAITCRAVIDASGDADVCLAAGEELDACDVNVPCGWFYYINDQGKIQLDHFSREFDFGARTLPASIKEGFACTDARDVTAMVLASNRAIEERLAKLRQARSAPADLLRPPSIPSYRMTRRLVGQCELALADDRRWFDDTVGLISHWRERGPIYAIPLRSLIGHTPNLLAVGRCMSAARDAWDLTRVIPACAVTGEAAGVAAAMLAAEPRVSAKDLNVSALQKRLRRRGVILDRALLRSSVTNVDPEAAAQAH